MNENQQSQFSLKHVAYTADQSKLCVTTIETIATNFTIISNK